MAIPHDPYEVAPPVEHGWATTALHSMLSKEASSEELKAVWTTAALVLKGYDAVPVELKILLDRLFATYHDSIRLERRHRLAYLGWSEEEYERGYKIVVSSTGGISLILAAGGPYLALLREVAEQDQHPGKVAHPLGTWTELQVAQVVVADLLPSSAERGGRRRTAGNANLGAGSPKTPDQGADTPLIRGQPPGCLLSLTLLLQTHRLLFGLYHLCC